MNKKKIAIIGGYGDSQVNFRGNLTQDLVARGYEVHSISPLPSPWALEQLQAWGVIVHILSLDRAGMNPLRDLGTLIALVGMLKKIRPQKVLCYFIKPVIYGCLAARIARVPGIYALIEGLGASFGTSGLKGWLLSKIVSSLYRLSLGRVNGVIFLNPDDVSEFSQRKIITPNSRYLRIAGIGVDLKQFIPVPLPDEVSFLLIARLLKSKGVVEYIEAARQVRAQYPDCQFHLVGWLDVNPACIEENQLSAWVQEGVVRYWGKLDDVRPAIRDTTVFVLPSYREGMPRTIMEAMAMGRAVITTDVPGCREMVDDGVNGYIVEARSAEHLAKAMLACLKNPGAVPQMGQASLEMARDRFDVKKINRQMLEFMQISV